MRNPQKRLFSLYKSNRSILGWHEILKRVSVDAFLQCSKDTSIYFENVVMNITYFEILPKEKELE